MEHRHIDAEQGRWNATIVHSIWERGSEADICALVHEVRTNHNAVRAVRSAIPHSKVYGWPKFFKMYLDKIYGKKK